jgi:putative transposase
MSLICNFETSPGKKAMGAFSVSKSEEAKVDRYIRNQEDHHRKRTFKEELIGLLEKHGIEYDKRYVWD